MVKALVDSGVTHVPYLPDIERNTTYVLMDEEPTIQLIPVAREGETFGIAAGLIAGGKKPLIVIQNTGMFESGDSVRGFTYNAAVPYVMMIGYRGWTPHGTPRDTAAVFTEPLLKAWGIKYYLLTSDDDLHLLSTAFEEAEREGKAIAVLLPEDTAFAATKDGPPQ